MLRSSAHVCVIVVSRVEVRQLCMSPFGNVINFFTRVLCGECLARVCLLSMRMEDMRSLSSTETSQSVFAVQFFTFGLTVLFKIKNFFTDEHEYNKLNFN